MYAQAVRCFKVAVFRLALTVGVLVIAVCWAALFLVYLVLVGFRRMIPRRGERRAPVVRRSRDLTTEKTRTTT